VKRNGFATLLKEAQIHTNIQIVTMFYFRLYSNYLMCILTHPNNFILSSKTYKYLAYKSNIFQPNHFIYKYLNNYLEARQSLTIFIVDI